MAAADADNHIRALQLARACIALGARLGTVVHVTGLRAALLRTHFFRNGGSVNGRRPESSEWIHCGNILTRAEASEFASVFSELRERQRCAPADALVLAYRMYADSHAGRPTLSFDRAFSLVCQLLGIWQCSQSSLAMQRCPRCQARYLAEIGAPPPATGCVFCHLLHRYSLDPRVKAHFLGRQATPSRMPRPGGDPKKQS
ncbi:MAG: flagellar transcriptional regulator FlhC [Burkholderiaceae bacterium]|nr:flagellar transcriptional regulator FlhC [Burkholderiaceae bacterium]